MSIDELLDDIDEFGQIGATAEGGVTRRGFSSADSRARDLLVKRMQDLGLEITVDPAANVIGTRTGEDPSLPPIWIGSHLDTVPNGGKYDGALGVLTGLEVLRRLEDSEHTLDHPVAVVNFTAEEPNPYGVSTFGSKAVTGKLEPADLESRTDKTGRSLPRVLDELGGSFDRLGEAAREPGSLAAFLELHVEQGRRLVDQDLPVAVVEGAVGIYRDSLRIIGEANHTGTTLINHRKDALLGAASAVQLLRESVVETNRTVEGPEAVATIGRLDNRPNVSNVIPAQVDCSVEIRGPSVDRITDIRDRFYRQLTSRLDELSLEHRVDPVKHQGPIRFSGEVQSGLISVCEERDIPYDSLLSMAGHDACHLTAIAPTGMVFAASRDGKSHCPDEWTSPEAIRRSVEVLTSAVVRFDHDLK